MNEPQPTARGKATASRQRAFLVFGAVVAFGIAVWLSLRENEQFARQQLLTQAALRSLNATVSTGGASARPSPSAANAGDKTFELLPIRMEPETDANAIKHFHLHIPIRALTHGEIKVKDVVIHVLFYDRTGDWVGQTNARISSRWTTQPPNWIQRDTEELDAEYLLPKPELTTQSSPSDRKYYGYLVRVYYQGRLQAATSDPERLEQQYPAPAVLPQKSSSPKPTSPPT